MNTIRSVGPNPLISILRNDALENARDLLMRFFMKEQRGVSFGHLKSYYIHRDGSIIEITVEELDTLTSYAIDHLSSEFMSDYERIYISDDDEIPCGWTFTNPVEDAELKRIAKKLRISYPINWHDLLLDSDEVPERVGEFKEHPYPILEYYIYRN